MMRTKLGPLQHEDELVITAVFDVPTDESAGMKDVAIEFPAPRGIEEFTRDRTLVWEFDYSNNQHLQHHDIERLPNGNVLMTA